MDSQAFQAKDHGNNTIELIAVMPGIIADHPTIQTLSVFSRKFQRHILRWGRATMKLTTAVGGRGAEHD